MGQSENKPAKMNSMQLAPHHAPKDDKESPPLGKWRILAVVAVAIAALIIWGAWPRPTPVEVVSPQISPLIGHLSATGEIDGKVANVGAKTAGEVEQVYVAEGERVADGAPLARISPSLTGIAAPSSAQLNMQVIDSPFAGVVARRYVDLGDAVSPGQPLFTVVDPQQVWVVAYIDDIDMPKVHRGLPVRVTLPAYLATTYHGKITAIGPLAKPRTELESGARTVRVRIDLNEPMLDMIPGTEVNVDATVTLRSQALLIPADAVNENQQGRYVWVVRKGRAYQQQITTGLTNYLAVEVRDGLTEADLVIIAGQQDLEPGQRVRPQPTSVPLNPE